MADVAPPAAGPQVPENTPPDDSPADGTPITDAAAATAPAAADAPATAASDAVRPPVIAARDLGIRFTRGSPRAILSRGLRRALGLPVPPDESQDLWALRHVDFEVPHGTRLGLCGANGSGKTTLLRLISGIYEPDEGSLGVAGRTSALLSLGVGVSASLSGRDNLAVVGALHRLTRAEVFDRYEEIREFAGLDEATMCTPVRHYSSGMRTRLGFAIYSVLTPEILLIDEVLAVGDAAFRRRSSERLQKIAGEARCVVIASHNLPFLKDNCDQVLWMHQGDVKALGDPADVVAEYAEFMANR